MGSELHDSKGGVKTELDSRRVVLFTGFGPFSSYKVNPAWLALQALEKRCDAELPVSKFKFVFRMIPVAYDAVQKTMAQWWEELKPELIIHVGTGLANGSIYVEQRSYNDGYCHKDVEDQVPCDNCYAVDGPEFLETEFNVRSIVEEVNAKLEEMDGLNPAKLSMYPGCFLCGYIYYQSLRSFSRRCLFIHVPPTDGKIVTAEKLARGIKLAALAAIKQLDTVDKI